MGLAGLKCRCGFITHVTGTRTAGPDPRGISPASTQDPWTASEDKWDTPIQVTPSLCHWGPLPHAGIPMSQASCTPLPCPGRGAILPKDIFSIYLYLPVASASLRHDFFTITMAKSNDIRLMTSGLMNPALVLQGQPQHPIRRLGKELEVPHLFRGPG